MHFRTFDRFYPKAEALRQVFDDRFADPLQTNSERFQWDYWHVPGEYTNLRTPAYHYFPRRLYENFHRYLVNWGRQNLGCHDVSPPWLSCYVQGCRQEPHQDLPHGPLAFVFSLTRWSSRCFDGGETFIVKPRTEIEPKFNRLTIFNPALVHGVREVKGTHDPRRGRLVIHGWFVNPRPFWTGPLELADVQDALDLQLPKRIQPHWNLGHGLISLRLKIQASGSVSEIKVLVNTLADAKPADLGRLEHALRGVKFPKYRGISHLTLPLLVAR